MGDSFVWNFHFINNSEFYSVKFLFNQNHGFFMNCWFVIHHWQNLAFSIVFCSFSEFSNRNMIIVKYLHRIRKISLCERSSTGLDLITLSFPQNRFQIFLEQSHINLSYCVWSQREVWRHKNYTKPYHQLDTGNFVERISPFSFHAINVFSSQFLFVYRVKQTNCAYKIQKMACVVWLA